MQIKDPIIINPGNASAMYSYVYISQVTPSGVDDWAGLQSEIDDCILKGVTAMFIPKGYYKISKPLFISRTVSGNYGQVTFRLFGDASMWDSFSTTVIEATFSDTFIVGIQMGKGCTIENLRLKGKFISPSLSDFDFYNTLFADYTDGVCRDSRFSPYSGIVIDPFTNNSSQVPADGGYPAMTAYYKGSGSTTSGSTATTIRNCSISNVVIGICSSPNGYTRNAEITTIEDVQFTACKLWISGSHDQEKANSINRVAGWSDTHTVFATGLYGAMIPGNWNIDTVNIAGRCNRFIENVEVGYFASSITNVYAEGIGRFGKMQSYLLPSVTNSIFDFVYPQDVSVPKYYIEAIDIRFRNCQFRTYGKNAILPIQGEGSIFDSCYFSGIPLHVLEASVLGRYPTFINCEAKDATLGMNQVRISYKNGGELPICIYGNWIMEEVQPDYGFHQRVKSTNHEVCARILADTNITLSISGHIATFTSLNPSWYILNEGVMVNSISGFGFGIVTAISGSSITISYITLTITSGVYDIITFHQILFGSIMGDIASGNNQITNVKNNWYNFSVGSVLINSYSSKRYVRITAISGTTYTVNSNFSVTKTGAYFGQNTRQEIWSDNPAIDIFSFQNYIINKGDRAFQGGNAENALEYKITATGWNVPPSGDTRQATWTAI